MDIKVNPGISGAVSSAAASLSKENISIAKTIVNALKTGGLKKGDTKLTWGARKALQTALKNVTNPNQRALLIQAIGAAFAKGALGIGSGVAEIATSIVTPIMASKTDQAKIAAEVSKQGIAASEAIAKRAIEAGVWNSGITGLPVSSSETTQGQTGTTSGDGTPGSFLGG